MTGDVVLHKKRDFVGEADADLVRQTGGLAEVDKVLEGKSKGDRLTQLNLNVFLGLVEIGVASEGHGAVTDITVACELDTVLGSLNHHCRCIC